MNGFEEAMEQTQEYGEVEQVRYPLLLVRGLPGAILGEVVFFEDNTPGQVVALHDDLVEIMVLDHFDAVVGARVTRTNERLSLPVGDHTKGSVIDPLGIELERMTSPTTKGGQPKDRDLEVTPLNIEWRARIDMPFHTGKTVVDLLLPMGRGQRQVVVGDKKTGKTSFLLSTIKTASSMGVVAVYAAIGKKWSDIKRVVEYIKAETNAEEVIVVATSAEDVPSRIFQTPYAAMTVAEYWRDRGQDVLIIFDDLTTHAQFYRQMSLISRRFPGRESYPGDVFYIHSRLLERAGNFTHPERGTVSITCMPVAESVNGDLTGYIISNLIGITDGHFLFDAATFSEGRRPAVDLGLSVTRVGKQTQHGLVKKFARAIADTFVQYRRAQELAQFGAELNQETSAALDAGDKLWALFTQPYQISVPAVVQLLTAGMVWQGWFQDHGTADVKACRDAFLHEFAENPKNEVWNIIQQADNADDFAKVLQENKTALMDIWQKRQKSKQNSN